MDIVGLSPDGNYVEVIEIKEHPYFLAVQYHPEFKKQTDKTSSVIYRLDKRLY